MILLTLGPVLLPPEEAVESVPKVDLVFSFPLAIQPHLNRRCREVLDDKRS